MNLITLSVIGTPDIFGDAESRKQEFEKMIDTIRRNESGNRTGKSLTILSILTFTVLLPSYMLIIGPFRFFLMMWDWASKMSWMRPREIFLAVNGANIIMLLIIILILACIVNLISQERCRQSCEILAGVLAIVLAYIALQLVSGNACYDLAKDLSKCTDTQLQEKYCQISRVYESMTCSHYRWKFFLRIWFIICLGIIKYMYQDGEPG